MTTNESTPGGRARTSDDRKGIRPRPKSVPEIRDAVSDHIDEMDGSSFSNRLLTSRYRRVFSNAFGRVLDVACGTGTNLEYLPETVEYVGVDISPEMLARAADRFDELDRGASLREMDAQNLEFEDDSFDTVISSMSTCMFPDPTAALREMGRVCQPDGRILLIEHGRSSVGAVAWIQDRRADKRYEETGCRWNQEPLDLVSRSELDVKEASTGLFGMVTTIEASPLPTQG